MNDDGFADLLLTKGNVSAEPGFAMKDPSDLFLGQPSGPWVQAAEEAGIVDFARGRGASVADFNLDGLPDLVEVFYGAPVKAWRNVGSGTPRRRRRWGTGWSCVSPSPPRTPTRSARGSR